MRLMKMSERWRSISIGSTAVALVVALLLCQPAFLVARNTGPSRVSATVSARAWVRKDTARLGKQEAAQQKKTATAGDAYMNIQVLKDIPSNELIPSMRYVSAALGVECEFCHDTKHFDSDDKQEKKTARNMISMMFALNKDNFNGRREVTCYTCHHGASHPTGIPVLMAAGTVGGPSSGTAAPTGAPAPHTAGAAPGSASSAAPTLPNTSVDAILAKYADALGGEAAIQKITTLGAKGSIELPGRGGHPGMNAQAEVFRKAPDKAFTVVHLPNGTEFQQGYNGTAGWHQAPGHGAEELTGDDLVRLKQWSSFIPGLNLKQDFSRAQLAGSEKIGDRDAYRVIAFRKGGGQVRFYFDAQSGLLLRVSERIESPLGALPQDTDYADYRDVSGVKMPFSVTVAHVEGPTVYKWDQILTNAPVDDARFDKPASKSTQP